MAAGKPDTARAVEEWRRLLGADLVRESEGEEGSRTTLARAQRPAGLIEVRSREQVIEAVRIAGRHGVPVYPVSRGKNWGYGDASPVGPGQFVLDLSGMDRIFEVDPALAYAVVEPGVTQRQLHDHLTEHGHGLWMSPTASSPDASVVGNLIERGFGATPYGDHAAHACGLEVVLADGTMVQTGLDRYPGAAGFAYRWGLGPHVEGLFTQSNFGVVVRAGIWLLPRPDGFAVFRLMADGEEAVEDLIDRLRDMRLAGVLTAPVFVENTFRRLANVRRYPWEETEGATPLSRELAKRLLAGSEGHAGAWVAVGSFYGTRRAVKAAIRDAKSALRPLGRLSVVTPSRLERARRWARPMVRLGLPPARRLERSAGDARSAMRLLQGEPVRGGLDVSRWRLRRPAEGPCEDPTAEGCGLYWLVPVCPAKGYEVGRCVRMIETRMLEAGFEPLIRIAVVDARAVLVTTLLTFDRDDREQSEKADACHRGLTAELIDAGYPPYRGSVGNMDLLDPNRAPFWELTGRLKQALDPAGILAPGRYDPGRAERLRDLS